MVFLLIYRDGIAAAFSDDFIVNKLASKAIIIVALLQPLNGLVFVGDGIFQGALDFSYLAFSMAFASASALLVLNVGIENSDFTTIWVAFAVLQIGRAAGLGFRYYNTIGAGPLA